MEGMKEFMERAEGRAPSSTAVGKPPQPRRTSTVRSYYNPDSLRAILDLSGMPDKPVRIGDSWPVQREAGPTPGPGGALIVNATYTLKGWQEHEQKRCARIDISGTLGPKTGNTPARQGVSSPLEKSKVTGQCWLDPVLEFPIETALDQSYTVNSVVAQLRQGTNAPVQTRQGTNSPPQRRTGGGCAVGGLLEEGFVVCCTFAAELVVAAGLAGCCSLVVALVAASGRCGALRLSTFSRASLARCLTICDCAFSGSGTVMSEAATVRTIAASDAVLFISRHSAD
jgi:hypothetical protein